MFIANDLPRAGSGLHRDPRTVNVLREHLACGVIELAWHRPPVPFEQGDLGTLPGQGASGLQSEESPTNAGTGESRGDLREDLFGVGSGPQAGHAHPM